MKKLSKAVRLSARLAAIFFVLGTALAGCNDAFDEDFTAEMAGWSAVGTLTNTCLFGTGEFDDSQCRYR